MKADLGRTLDQAALLLVALCGAGLSWFAWPDPFVDFGHQLYIPWRIASGDRLGRDIAYAMGPLSQLINAGWFVVAGPSLSSLCLLNFGVLLATAALLHRFYLDLGDRLAAWLAALVHLTVFAFSQFSLVGNYNAITPYRHEMTHGLLAGLALLAALRRFDRSGKAHWLAAAGCCLAATALMKLEVCLPAAGACAAWCLTGNLGRSVTRPDAEPRRSAASWRLWTWFLGGAALPVLACVVVLAQGQPLATAWRQTWAAWDYALRPELTTGAPFYQALAGWNAPGVSLARIGTAAAGCGAAGVVLVLLGRWFRAAEGRPGLLVFLGLSSFVAGSQIVSAESWDRLARALPLVMLVVGGGSAARWLSTARMSDRQQDLRTDARDRARWLTIWAVFSLLCLVKVLLNVQWGHYGFVLALPAGTLLAWFAMAELPGWGGRLNRPSGVVRALAVGLVLLGCAAATASNLGVWRARSEPFGRGADRFYVDGNPNSDPRIPVLREALEHLERRLKPNRTLLVIPDGSMLNFLLRARNPTRHLLLSPWEIAAMGGEEAVLADLRHGAPDLILVVETDMSLHGTGPFGSDDYGGRIRSWIETDYQAARRFTPAVSHRAVPFSAVLWERRAAETGR